MSSWTDLAPWDSTLHQEVAKRRIQALPLEAPQIRIFKTHHFIDVPLWRRFDTTPPEYWGVGCVTSASLKPNILDTHFSSVEWFAALEARTEILPYRPGGNLGANGWFLQPTPIQMPPQRVGICGRLPQDLPSTRLQGG